MMTEKEFHEFIASSVKILKERQKKLQSIFDLDSYERYDWDQQSGQLVFSHHCVKKVIADIQFVGSYSKITKTWLWSWANLHLEDRIKQDMRELKVFGEQNGIAKLTSPKWEADEYDCWDMTSVAANFFNAEGVYRTEEDNGFTYMMIQNVRWVNVVAA